MNSAHTHNLVKNRHIYIYVCISLSLKFYMFVFSCLSTVDNLHGVNSYKYDAHVNHFISIYLKFLNETTHIQ